MYKFIDSYVAYWLGCYYTQSFELKTEVQDVMGNHYEPLPALSFFTKLDGEQLYVAITIADVPRGYGSHRYLVAVADEDEGQKAILECHDFIDAMILDNWRFNA